MKSKILILITFIFTNTISGQCFLNNNDSFVNGRKIYNSSGNENIDKQYFEIFEELKTYPYKVKAGFYDDSNSPNAFAMTTSNPQYDGETYFGLNLLNRYLGDNQNSNFLNINLIVLHEYAHIIQYNNGMNRNRATKWNELQADFIAGLLFKAKHFIKKASTMTENRLFNQQTMAQYNYLALNLFRSIGDTNFGNPSHHGTADERSSAFWAGLTSSEILKISNLVMLNDGSEGIKSVDIDINQDIIYELSNIYVENLMKYSSNLKISKENLSRASQEWTNITSRRHITNLTLSINEATDKNVKSFYLLQRAESYEKLHLYNKAILDYENYRSIKMKLNQNYDKNFIDSNLGLCYSNINKYNPYNSKIQNVIANINNTQFTFQILENKKIYLKTSNLNNKIKTNSILLGYFNLLDGSAHNMPDAYIVSFVLNNKNGGTDSYQLTVGNSPDKMFLTNLVNYKNTTINNGLKFKW